MRLKDGKTKTQADYLYDTMVKHNVNEISVLSNAILTESMVLSHSKNKRVWNYFYRVINSARGRQLFEYVGMYYFPYLSYKCCRVYGIKTIREEEKNYEKRK